MWPFYLVCGLVCLVYWKYRQQHKYNLPPGPWKLPLIGSLIQVLRADAKLPAVAFQKLAQKYGNIFYIRLGYVPTVVINGHELITKVANNEDFSDRNDENDEWILEKSEGLTLGLLFSKRKFWTDTRTFTHKLLKKYGFGTKSVLESLILDDLEEFISELRIEMSKANGVIYICRQFDSLFLNIIWTLITSKRLHIKDNTLQKISSVSHDYIKSGQFGGGIAGLYPGLIKLFPWVTGFTKLRKTCAEFRRTIMHEMTNRRINRAYEGAPESFLDEFLRKIDETDDLGSVYDTVFTDANLVAVIQDLIMGGTDTESNLMKFFVRYMLFYPEIQKKIHEELDNVLCNRRMSIEDIPNLTYTQAAMYELLRLGNIAPVVPRKAVNDIRFEGYDIPCGTLIICNIWTANLDESVWEHPDIFYPERFIDENGHLVNTEKIFSFGLGKRMCIGNGLARSSLMLTICVLMQEFKFEIDNVKGIPPDSETHEFTRDAAPYHVLIKNRCAAQDLKQMTRFENSFKLHQGSQDLHLS